MPPAQAERSGSQQTTPYEAKTASKRRPSREASCSQSYRSARSKRTCAPACRASFRAETTASSLISTPVTLAPSPARLIESPPELHWRWRRVFPPRSPKSPTSSGKSVLPPSRRNPGRFARWLSWAPTTAFHDNRFCSRTSLPSTVGFYIGPVLAVREVSLKTASKPATVSSHRGRPEARRIAAEDILALSTESPSRRSRAAHRSLV